jgi:hypothetical protein
VGLCTAGAGLSLRHDRSWHIADDVLIGSKVRDSRGTSPQFSDRLRRIFLLAAHRGEGRFTQPTSATQAWPRELVFMPQMRHSRPQR